MPCPYGMGTKLGRKAVPLRPNAVLFRENPARGRIAVSGRFAVTLETRSCSSFAGRR